MSNSESKNIMIHGKVLPTFFTYAIPWVLALLAQSSAGIIDGIFIGKYCGTLQLAATNLIIPVYSVFMAIAIVFCVGGVVRYAKYLGEGNLVHADAIFTKIIIVMIIFSLAMALFGYLFAEPIMSVLGVRGNVYQYSLKYFLILLAFVPFFMIGFSLSSFVRADGNVLLAGIAPLIGVVLNILLDFVLIAKLKMGIAGAAYATGVSQLTGFLILLLHFFWKNNNLRFTKHVGSFKEIVLAAYNGSSELFSEMSTGIIILLYNRVLMAMAGENGIAAFTIVSYLSFVVMMVGYGVSDNLGPIISANYGAKNKVRILQFLGCGLILELLFGIVTVLVLTFASENLILMFINKSQAGAQDVISLTSRFILIFKWGFILSGVNIIMATLFTGLHLPGASLIIAVLRGIILPITLLNYLPKLFNLGLDGVFMAMPISELITFTAAVIVFIFVWKKRSREITISKA